MSVVRTCLVLLALLVALGAMAPSPAVGQGWWRCRKRCKDRIRACKERCKYSGRRWKARRRCYKRCKLHYVRCKRRCR